MLSKNVSQEFRMLNISCLSIMMILYMNLIVIYIRFLPAQKIANTNRRCFLRIHNK